MEQKTISGNIEVRSKSVFEGRSAEDGYRVCVMRFIRQGYDFDLWIEDLAPSAGLLTDYRNGRINWKEYEKRYLEEIRGKEEAFKRLVRVIRERKVVTLLCAEKEDTHCHRRLLIELVKPFLTRVVFDDEEN
jgi:uncharacterized protein YeaO (DUF488 family)